MNNKYIIENLTDEKLGTIFYILRFRPDFYYDNLKEFFEERCRYIDIYNINTKDYCYRISLTGIGLLNISMLNLDFNVTFPLKDLILCMEEGSEEIIYFKGKYDYNKYLRIPLYFKNCTYDSNEIKIKLDIQTFTSLMEFLSDYITKDEE